MAVVKQVFKYFFPAFVKLQIFQKNVSISLFWYLKWMVLLLGEMFVVFHDKCFSQLCLTGYLAFLYINAFFWNMTFLLHFITQGKAKGYSNSIAKLICA